MGDPLGRSSETLTNPDRPDGAETGAGADPSTDFEAPSDPDAALRRGEDPLDAHKPGMPRNDPLDPDGHVI
jgi:hypothetical protein